MPGRAEADPPNNNFNRGRMYFCGEFGGVNFSLDNAFQHAGFPKAEETVQH